MSLVNFFHSDADNIGDLACGPGLYFPELACSTRNLHAPVIDSDFIVGGGLVYAQAKELALRNRTLNKPVRSVAWGIGAPLKKNKYKDVVKAAALFSLFSTRNFDWKDDFEFVPCPSCMSPWLDSAPEPKHEVVAFVHKRKTPDMLLPEGVPFKTNARSGMREAIEFIASGEIVVTSSYHGTYWAQLLGRRVICIPFGDKFYSLEHRPRMATVDRWMAKLNRARRAPPRLQEYRERNIAFMHKVRNLLG